MKAGYPRRGLHGEVVHTIGVRILRGDLAPGELLPNEAELGSELHVSRTVLREAIKVLAAKGLVESRPKTGTRVRPRRGWNLLDPDVLAWRIAAGPEDRFRNEIFVVRRLIEPAAARLAAERRSDEQLQELRDLYADMVGAVADNDAPRHVAADLRFHAAIYRACDNELLGRIGEILRAAYREIFMLITHLPGASQEALPLHAAVLAAIVAADGDAAEVATLALIDRSATFPAKQQETVPRPPSRPVRA
jgi:DNA-binding FadR family transcriptional regulator